MPASKSTASPRLHVEAALHPDGIVDLLPAQAHYLGSVLRRGAGMPVRVFNGVDGEWLAVIEQSKRDRGTLRLQQLLRPQRAEADLWLAFAPLKRDATDLLVQKATELGAAALLPVFTERTNAARVADNRLRAIAVEAAEQCERLTVPRIAPPCSLRALLAQWQAGRSLVVAMERVVAPAVTPASGPAALLIGPEGGFTPQELDLMRRHPFVEPATLGPLILRAETAAIVGLALLQAAPRG